MPRPETDTIELRVDSIEEIIDVLEVGANGGDFADTDLTRERAKAILSHIRAQRSSNDNSYLGIETTHISYDDLFKHYQMKYLEAIADEVGADCDSPEVELFHL